MEFSPATGSIDETARHQGRAYHRRSTIQCREPGHSDRRTNDYEGLWLRRSRSSDFGDLYKSAATYDGVGNRTASHLSASYGINDSIGSPAPPMRPTRTTPTATSRQSKDEIDLPMRNGLVEVLLKAEIVMAVESPPLPHVKNPCQHGVETQG